MPASPAKVANTIIDTMRSRGLDFATIPWSQFYDLADRVRISDVVQDNIAKELKNRDFLCAYGASVVVVSKDFNSQEL